MDRSKLYKRLVDSNRYRAALVTAYKNQAEKERKAKEEAQKKAVEAKKKAEAAKKQQESLEAKEDKNKKKLQTPAVHKWDAPAGSNLVSSANNDSSYKIPDYLKAVDNTAQSEHFNTFLAGQRRKMYDTVSQLRGLLNMYTGIPEEDAKVEQYKQATSRGGQMQMQTAIPMQQPDEFSWGEENYGIIPWASDAFSAMGQKINEAQLEAAYGEKTRAQEYLDLAAQVQSKWEKEEQLDDINNALAAINDYYGGKDSYGDVNEKMWDAREKNLNDRINALKKYYPDINLNNYPDYFKKIMADRADLAMDVLSKQSSAAEKTLHSAQTGFTGGGTHLLRQIGIAMHDNDKAESNWRGTTSDWYGDRVDESLDQIAGWETASKEDRKKMLSNLVASLKKVQDFDDSQAAIQEQELKEWNEKHKISKEWNDRVRRGQAASQKQYDGAWDRFKGTWLNTDNLLYNQVEQLGYSASSWDKQAVGMVLQTAALVATGGSSTVGQMVGSTMATAGGVIGVSSGKDENDQEIMEGYEQRLTENLSKAGVLKEVLKEGHRLFPRASEQDIIKKISRGLWVPNNSKALQSLKDEIDTSVQNARKGINATFQKDMMAVAVDEAFGAALTGATTLPKGIGSVMSKKFADNAKYRFIRSKANKALGAVEEAVETSTSAGLGLVGAPFVAAGKVAAKSKAGKWVVAQGSKAGEKLASTKVGKMVADGASKAVEVGKMIPTKLLAKTSPEAAYLLEKRAKRLLLGKETVDEFGNVVRSKGGVLNLGKKVVSKGISEAVEEGKQYDNKKEWVENENPQQVIGLFDLLLSDASKGLPNLVAAAGIPFGAAWGMSNDPEKYANMQGGFFGGGSHQFTMQVASSAISNVLSNGGQISIADALVHNAILDSHNSLNRFMNGTQLAKRLAKENTTAISAELNAYAEFNKRRKEQGLSYVDPDVLMQEEDYINQIANTSRLNRTREQAKAAGIKIGSDDYNKFVSATVMYNNMADEQKKKLNEAQAPINNILTRATVDFNSDSVADFLDGQGVSRPSHPIVELFKNTNKKEKKSTSAVDDLNNTLKLRNEARDEYKNSEKAYESSVYSEAESLITPESDDTIFKRGLSTLAELAGLTEYLNAIETLDSLSEMRKRHDVKYIKKQINDRIKLLKSTLPKEKIEEIMRDPSAYYEDKETFDALKDAYQTRMGVQIEYDTTRMMQQLLSGKIDPQVDEKTKSLRIGWKLSKAKDVLERLQYNIDQDRKFVDEVNKEFELRSLPQEEPQPLPDTEESKAVDDAIASAEEEMVAPEPVEERKEYTTPSMDVRKKKKSYNTPSASVRDKKKSYITPSMTVNEKQQEQTSANTEKVVSEEELMESLGELKSILNSMGLSNAQIQAINPALVLAGIKVMMYNLQKGSYKFDDAVIGTYITLKEAGFTDKSIYELVPYFKQWYMAAQMNPQMLDHFDEFDSPKDVKNTDIEAIIAAYENANSTPEQQEKDLNDYKEELIQKYVLNNVFETLSEALNTVFNVGPDKFAVLDPVTKLYEIFEVTKFENGKPIVVKNGDGIVVVNDGKQLTQKQIQSLYDAASSQPSDQKDQLDRLNEQIDKDNANVVGVTGHDYFIKNKDGKVVMYPRVHTVMGDQYEGKKEVEQAHDEAVQKLTRLIESGNKEALEEYVKDIDGYKLYLDQLEQDSSTKDDVIEALANLKSREEAGASVDVGNIADEIVRIFFDSNALTIAPLSYDTLKVTLRGKEYNISQFMEKSVFDDLIQSLTELDKEYKKLGYVISSRRHTWYAEFPQPDGSILRIAGETDLIAIDEEGKYHILDTKTSKSTFGTEIQPAPSGDVVFSPFTDGHSLFDYKTRTSRKAKWSTKHQYSRQLTAYMMIIQKAMPNVVFAESPIEVLPIRVEYNYNSVTLLLDGGLVLEKPVTRINNGGLNKNSNTNEPTRIILDVQLDLINGLFQTKDKLSEDLKILRDLGRKMQTKVELVIDEIESVADKIKELSEEHYNKLLGVFSKLEEIRKSIAQDRDDLEYDLDHTESVIEKATRRMSAYSEQIESCQLQAEIIMQDASNVKKPQKTLDRRRNDRNAITELYRKAYEQSKTFIASPTLEEYNKLKSAFQAVIVAVNNFENTYENVTEFDDIIKPAINWFLKLTIPTAPAPALSKTPTTDGFGWKFQNTAEMNSVNESKAQDGSMLMDVTGEPEFSKEAVCEVVGAPYTRKDGIVGVPVVITYKGKTYSQIFVQFAEDKKGSALRLLIQEAFAKKEPGDKLILTGMHRTAGRVKKSSSMTNAKDNPLITSMSLYDVSTEYASSKFGIARRDKDTGKVRVLGQGNTASGSNALYTFGTDDRGNAGVVYAIVRPSYNTATTLVTPLINVSFSQDDAVTLANLIARFMDNSLPEGERDKYYVTLEDGTSSQLPLRVRDLIQIFLPIGKYDGVYNNASYVRFEQGFVIFSTPSGEKPFDVNSQFNDMIKYIKSLRISVDETVINSRLGQATTTAHPFGRLATWFQKNPNVKSILIGSSRFTFDRSDFKNPNNPGDRNGLSGLGWMIKCGVFVSDYEGVHDPRFSFDEAKLASEEKQPTEDVVGVAELDDQTVDGEDYVVDGEDYDDGYWNKTQTGKAEKTVSKEKVIKRLQRIFGKDIAVEVVENIYDVNGKLIPGVVGRLYGDVIKICERAAEGTEFHEAFHRVSQLLLPKSMQKILYRGIKNAMKKKLGKKAADAATDRQIEEFGANECERYFMGIDTNLTLRHPFEFIRGHYLAYQNVGSLRMYLVYLAMNNGLFRNMKTRNTDIPNAYKFQVHGVGMNYIYDDKMYNTLLKSMLYYIMYAQKIRKDGKNINTLDLSKEAFDIIHSIKKPLIGKNGKKVRDKNGKVVYGEPFEKSIRDMLNDSCKTEIGKLAAKEAIDNWDVVKMDLISMIGEFGIDYEESVKLKEIVEITDKKAIEDEESVLAGDPENGDPINDMDQYTKDPYETSRTAKATSGIRFFTSMIKKYEFDENGKQIETRNELGFYEFMDGKDVLVKIFSDCHDVKSPTELVKRIEQLANTDKTYVQIRDIVKPMYEHQYNKDGSVNANTEQFITQLFNLVASYKMEFKRINAMKDRKTKMYALSVENCGQEYEEREYRKSWGMLLTYGGTSLFTRNQEGQIAPIRLENEKYDAVTRMGAVFDKLSEIKQQFSQENINKLLDGKEPTLKIDGKLINVTKEQDLFVLKRSICKLLNYIGIEFSVPEFDYMLKHKYGTSSLFDQLNQFFNETKYADISNLWTSDYKIIKKDQKTGKWNWNIYAGNKLYKDVTNITADTKNINAEDVYTKNSFCSELSKYKYMYNHETTDMSVLVSKGDTYYCISENNYISDITDELSKNGPVIEMLSKYCYNYVKAHGLTEDGTTDNSGEGSLILKLLHRLKEGEQLPIKVCTLVQFKTNEYGDEGSGYFDISEREDYTAKATILETGGIIFPTMSDKKTWVYLEGIQLPGIEYGQDPDKNFRDSVLSLDEDAVLDQLVEYADTELYSIEQTLKQVDEIPDNRKVDNFHKGGKTASVVDKDGVKHSIAQGTVFGSFVGMWDENDNYISFNRVLDDKGNFIDPKDNLEKAKEKFFSKSHEEKKRIMARILDHQTQAELEHLEQLGLVKRDDTDKKLFQNVGLNNDAISLIARYYIENTPQIVRTQPNFIDNANATRRYVRDIVSKSIMSIQEVERIYSGNPAFYKFEFTYANRKKNGPWSPGDGVLVDRSVDEFKRLGGLISTGVNNNVEIKGAPQDGMYTCAQVDNDETSSEQIDKIRETMAICEWRQAARQILSGNMDKADKATCIAVNSMSIEKLKELVKEHNPSVYQIIENKIKQETESYAKGIDIADGGAYISPQMTEWLLRMCGEYDSRVQKAFEILKNPNADIYKQQEAYKLVTTKVIGALKYTAFGMRLSEDGLTTYPYYNKMALFPVFKCIATGKFAKLYDQMDKQGVHMLMIDSAVKVGGLGSILYSTDDSFQFNTYKQQFKYLRKQFNTNPHHKDEQSMGTQMVKVALSSLVMGNEYTREDGEVVTGEELLEQIMDAINELSQYGEEKVRDTFYTEDKIDQEKLSKFLHEQLSSRDSNKSILDAISLIPVKIGDAIEKILKFPLSATSSINWLQSILVSFINKRVIDVNTQGNAFYQRSVWNMEGNPSEFMSDENLPPSLNNGQNLKMIIEDGPAKGAMDCILTMDYFADVLKQAGLQNASFEEQKEALMQAGIIGPEAKACFIGYRIPTQAQSSIHPLRCVDVVPVIQHNIILPKEFTKITGSDFDIDKIYIGSLNFHLINNNGFWINEDSFLTEEQLLQNQLINDYITVLKDPNGVHIAHRSIDNDTELLKDVLADLEEGRKTSEEVLPYDFGCLRTHTRSKNDFLTGKIGIGPFALNNNSLVLTTLYGVKFAEGSLMDILGHRSLCRTTDDHGQSILSWISALINAHVDIAKDPYISRMNVNQMTYNLTNLLIRTGYGKNTFYFLKQPMMVKMAEKYRQSQGKFMQEEGKSTWLILKESKHAAVVELVGEDVLKEAMNLMYGEGNESIADTKGEDGGLVYVIMNYILNNKDDVARRYAKGEEFTFTIEADGYGSVEIRPELFHALVYLTDKELEKPAKSISDLVQYSKIDTKKQGKSVSEQLAYVKGVVKTFGDYSIISKIYGTKPLTRKQEEDSYEGDFEFDGIRNMYDNSFLRQKTHAAITTFLDIMNGQVFESTTAFRGIVDHIAQMLGKTDATSIQKISTAVAAKIKADAINEYATENEIDIPGLVTGHNTIYDRLNAIKCQIKTDPNYKYLLDGNGEIRNPLLRLLIADKSWTYDETKHIDSARDKFGNMKFVRLFDALDMSSSKTDYIIQAWDDLLNDASHPKIQAFARDLCVYAFVTSGDKGGRNKLFQYVPNSFREKSGYVEHIRTTLASMKDVPANPSMLTAEFIDDIILNNTDDYTFVPKVDISNKDWKEGQPKWISVYRNAPIKYVDDETNTYDPKYPILVSVDATTPIKKDDIKPYIKVKRQTDDGSQRSYTILKLVSVVDSEKKGYATPVYAKVNQRGYHIDGYDFYEYGNTREVDLEYFPSLDLIAQSVHASKEVVDAYAKTYGENYIDIAYIIGSTLMGPEYSLSERWVGAPKEVRTYNPIEENPAAPVVQPSLTINIYAGTNENADLSNFAERPFSPIKGWEVEGSEANRYWADLEPFLPLKFNSVEQAFQAFKFAYALSKSDYAPVWVGLEDRADKESESYKYGEKVSEHYEKILNAKSSSEARALGRQKNILKDEDIKFWDEHSSEVMKFLIKQSFSQNPKALQRLLSTGNATLTHTLDKGKWGTEFPKLLMEVREELRNEVNNTQGTNEELSFEPSQEELDADKEFRNTETLTSDTDGYSEFGKLSGLKEGVTYDADLIHEAYKRMPEYKTYSKLAEVVFDSAKQLGVKYTVNNSMNISGVAHKYDEVEINLNLLQSNTLLHESIHKVVSYWLDNEDKASPEVKAAITELRHCYIEAARHWLRSIIDDSAVDIMNAPEEKVQKLLDFWTLEPESDIYGFSSFEEFIAELSNPQFRSHLKFADELLNNNKERKESFFDKLAKCIFAILNFNKKYNSIEAASYQALKTLLTTVDKDLYDQTKQYYSKIKKSLDMMKKSDHLGINLYGLQADAMYERVESEDHSVHTLKTSHPKEAFGNDLSRIKEGSLLIVGVNTTSKHLKVNVSAAFVVTKVNSLTDDYVEFEYRMIPQTDIADHGKIQDGYIMLDSYQRVRKEDLDRAKKNLETSSYTEDDLAIILRDKGAINKSGKLYATSGVLNPRSGKYEYDNVFNSERSERRINNVLEYLGVKDYVVKVNPITKEITFEKRNLFNDLKSLLSAISDDAQEVLKKCTR